MEIHLQEKIWGRFGVEDLDPAIRRRAARWLLERGVRDESGMLSLALLSCVDPSRYANAFLKTLQKAVDRLDIRKIGHLLLWVPSSLEDHEVVKVARLWFLRSTGQMQRLLEEMPDPPPVHLRWMVLDAMGDLGRFDEAMELARKWEPDVSQASPEFQASIGTLLLKKRGVNQEAESIFYRLAKQSLSPFVRGRVEHGLGEVARFKGHEVQALRHFRRALRAIENTSYARGQAVLLVIQAVVLVQRGRLKEATRMFERALLKSREIHALDAEGYGSYKLGEVLLDRGIFPRRGKSLARHAAF